MQYPSTSPSPQRVKFFSLSPPRWLYLKPSPPHHPSKVSNNYISKVLNKHITKVSNKNACLKQKYFNINSKSSKVNQFRIISSLTNSISHPHPHLWGYHLKPIPILIPISIPIPAVGMNFIPVPAHDPSNRDSSPPRWDEDGAGLLLDPPRLHP